MLYPGLSPPPQRIANIREVRPGNLLLPAAFAAGAFFFAHCPKQGSGEASRFEVLIFLSLVVA